MAIPSGEIIVHCNHVDSLTSEGVQVDGQSGDESFAFSGCHFGDVASVEGNAAHELSIEVDHIPYHFLIADIGGMAAEATGCVFDDGKGGWQNFIQIFVPHFRELRGDGGKTYLGRV